MIAHDDEALVMDHRRATLAEECAHHGLAEVAFPKFFAVEIVAKQAGGTEPAVKALAIGGGRSGGEIIVAMRTFMRHASRGHLPP